MKIKTFFKTAYQIVMVVVAISEAANVIGNLCGKFNNKKVDVTPDPSTTTNAESAA